MAFKIADRVKEISTSTSTTPFALSGAIAGHIAFSAIPGIAVGDTLYYCIQAVDAAGTPTAEWECGLGTYSAANTLTRTTVTSSSNAGSLVVFSAGTKHVYLTMPAVQVAWARERLTANRTYYVRTDGSDSNTGLANTSGGAFLTIQKAVDVVCGTLDTAIYAVTISVADGSYPATVAMKPWVGGGSVNITGNTTTPANVLISGAFPGFTASDSRAWTIAGFKVATTSGDGVQVSGSSAVSIANLEFGACAASCIGSYAGARVSVGVGMAVSGNQGNACFNSQGGSISAENRTITLSNTPSFGGAFFVGSTPHYNSMYSMTFSGTSATGARYAVSKNSVCFVNGASSTYFPGNSVGSTLSGGQYV